MATPDPPTVVDWGNVDEVDLRQIPEFLGGYTNRAGIPDTKEGLRTRANASWPRFITEFIVCANEIWAGRKEVPQNTGGETAGKLWRQGDDEAWSINFDDFTLYSLPVPQILWPFNASRTSQPGAQSLDVSGSQERFLWEAMNIRGGVSGDLSQNRQVYGLRSTSGNHYTADAGVTGMTTPGDLTVCGFFTLPQWNQANDGVVLMAHRNFQSATETGAADRLGFELGLGSPGSERTDLALYYRDRDANDNERIVIPTAGSGASEGPIYLPWGREHFIAVQHYFTFATESFWTRVIVNGLIVHDAPVGSVGTPGTSANMRMIFGADWNGLRHQGGGIRNVAIWPQNVTQPTPEQLKTFYRVGAGFLPRASFPA